MNSEIDGILGLRIEKNTVQFFVEVRKELREHQLSKIIELARFYRPMMIVANRIFPNLKEKLRANNIGYLDGAGNVYLNTDGNYVWMEGHKHVETEKLVNNRVNEQNQQALGFYQYMGFETIARADYPRFLGIKNILLLNS